MSNHSTEEIYTFLEDRGLNHENLQTLKNEKIDRDVLMSMTEEQLKKYIPAHGDRLALRNFMKPSSHNLTKRKQTLLDRLRKKVQSRYGGKKSDDSDSDSDDGKKFQNSRKRKLLGNDNAKKEFRRIDIGWISKQEDGCKQVRTKQGGGTRKISMHRMATKEDIMREALNLFFRDGSSPKGSKDDFDFDVWDFAESPMQPNVTITDMYDSYKFGIIRVYLVSTLKNPRNIIEIAAEKAGILSDVESLPDPSLDDSSGTVQFGPFPPDLMSLNDTIPLPTEDTLVAVPQLEEAAAISFDSLPRIEIPTRPTTDSPEKQKVRSIIVHEGNILKDLMNNFKDAEILNDYIIVKRAGQQKTTRAGKQNTDYEAGDGIGMIRDVLSEFWSEFYEECTTGYTFKIPITRHDMQDEEWKSMARILLKGYIDYGYFPVSLAPCFMEECIYGKHDSNLLDVFLQYLTPSESATVQSALEEFESCNREDLIDFLDNHHGRVLLNKENVKPICLEIATKELSQDPRFVVDMWKDVLNKLHKDLSVQELQAIYEGYKPSTKLILSLLKFPNVVCEGQLATIRYMKQLVKEMDQNMLKKFLRFCTGSDLLVKDIKNIHVEFQHMEGLCRRPIAHTCGCVLKLSDNYLNYPDFRSEFNHVLRSGVWLMDFV